MLLSGFLTAYFSGRWND
ncbi:hypothetical protein [Kluyvera ascorbata]